MQSQEDIEFCDNTHVWDKIHIATFGETNFGETNLIFWFICTANYIIQ